MIHISKAIINEAITYQEMAAEAYVFQADERWPRAMRIKWQIHGAVAARMARRLLGIEESI